MSGSNCCFLNCIQISQEVGQVVWYYHLFKNFPHLVVIHTVKGFITVNEAEVLLGFSRFIYDPTSVGNLISGSFAFSKSSLYIWTFLVHLLLKPSLGHFEHYYFANMWNECCCEVVWTFFGIALLLDWKLTFSSPVATVEFSKSTDILLWTCKLKLSTMNFTIFLTVYQACSVPVLLISNNSNPLSNYAGWKSRVILHLSLSLSLFHVYSSLDPAELTLQILFTSTSFYP